MPRQRRRRRSPEATRFARNQRATANEFANDVWQMLRNRRCCGEKFRREYPIEPYTVDFCCVAWKFIVEVDGDHHFTAEGRSKDQIRDQFLAEQGYEVLRIPGYKVLQDGSGVRQQIETALKRRRSK